jgi:hypothetical protein
MVVIKQNLFQRVVDIFNEMHPGINGEIQWVQGMKSDADAWGETFFPDDGSTPVISIDAEIPVSAAIEIIAHELSHLAAGVDAGHSEAWEKEFEEIFQRWDKMSKESEGD